MPDADVKPEEKAAQAAPRGGGKLVPLLLTVNTVALVALAGVQVVSMRGARRAAHEPVHAGGGAAEKARGPGPTARLADFVVHLRDPDADRYARVSFDLELGDEQDREGLAARTPQIRDAFLAYLSDCTAEELRGSEALARVKGVLARKLLEAAPAVTVRGLYVTELVVQ